MPPIKFEFFRVAPVLMTTVSILAALLFQSVEWAMVVAGLFINGVIWGIINPIIQQKYPSISKRPAKSQCYFFHQKTLTEAGGMPSGHSQSAAFFSTWIVLMAIRHQVPMPIFIITVAIALWLTIGMMVSRVHQYRCHTALQASVGSLIGITTALIMWPATAWLFQMNKIDAYNAAMLITYLILLTMSGIPLLLFWHHNGDSLKLERFFWRNHRRVYYILQAIVFFLILSVSIYTRLIIVELFESIPFVSYMKKAVARGRL